MAAAIGAAIADGNVDRDGIGAVTFTAAGSPVYDRMQSRAVRAALGAAADAVPATTWEGTTGHALAATAVLGIVHAVQTVEEGEVLPIAGLAPHPSVDPSCTLRYLVDAPERILRRAVLALTVGFGGQNGATLVTSAEDRR